MTTTTYYNLNIVEGTDIVNPLTVDNPNYQKIDEVLHDNAVAGVTLATELTNATIHALTRENSDCSVIRFIATSNWKAGDSVTVDGVPVLALLPSGETLPDGAYVINANVLCVLTGTNLTVYVNKSSANASDITYKETNVEEALNSLNESMVTVTSDLSTVSSNVSTINSNLELDYSNASVKDLKSFLQATLNRLFTAVLNLVAIGVWNRNYPIEEFIGTGSYATEGDYFVTRSSTGSGYRTVSKIDLTPYKKITFVGKSNLVDGSHTTWVGVYNISNLESFVVYEAYTTSESTIVIDVSSLSGEHYVGINNYNTVSYTKSIILE